MIVIIAEKPSLGRNIAAGITELTGASLVRKNGYLEGGGYLVTWAFGHLFSLADIEDYENGTEQSAPSAVEDGANSGAKDKKKKPWSMEGLPCFPKEFRFRLRADDDGIRRQFELIGTLCNRADVDAIVNAGDADREGEIIVRLCIQHALKSEKKLLRLWLPDQTPKTVAAALRDMKEEADYDNLANEGLARTYIDWLYGVNLTRYATLKSGTLLRVGRVIVPIVRAIYERDMSIRHFKPDVYYAVVGRAEHRGETVEVVSKTRFSKEEKAKGEAFCRDLNTRICRVTDKKVKKEILPPGKLYSLSKLQNVLGKKYKMSMADSLAIVQKLYEEGYLTYPRTNSEYLATAEQDKIKEVLAGVRRIGYPVAFRFHKTIFDDSKIESHSALTPTYKIPDKTKLSEQEAQVYGTVMRRFVAVFCDSPCRVERTELTLTIDGGETFTLKGTVITERGWTAFDDPGMKDKILPPLEVGDTLSFVFSLQERETSPPRHYTIETLNNYLKNPFREEKAGNARKQKDAVTTPPTMTAPSNEETAEAQDSAEDAEEYRAIFEGLELGTEATRTGIIDNARKSGYIALKKDVYTILPDGEYLIESLAQMQINMDKYKTSTIGRALKSVFRGSMTVRESVSLAEAEIDLVFHPSEDVAKATNTGFFRDEIGVCPLCQKKVSRGKYSYGCLGYKEGCRFRIPISLCGRVITVDVARTLLTEGKTELLQGFISRAGKPFEASLALEGDGVTFVFPKNERTRTPYAMAADPNEAPPLPEDAPPERFFVH